MTKVKSTTKPSTSTKPVVESAITATEKAVFKLLVDTSKLEQKQVAMSDKLLAIAKAADTVNIFLDSCRNAEKAFKEISKSNTIPRSWSQTKSDIKAMFSSIKEFDTISQLKKVKNIQAAEKRKADKAAAEAAETAEKVEQAKAETNVINTANVLSAKLDELTVLLAEMPQDLAESMLNVFTAQAKTALESVNEKPKASKPKAKDKAKPKAKGKLDKAI